MFDCFTSTGKTVTEHRIPGTFNTINLKNSINLILYPDTTPFINVTAGQHLIDGIITELEGTTLYIRNENKCNWVRTFENTYTVTIGMRDLVDIEYFGSGEIRCIDTIRSNEFTFNSWNGSGSVHLLMNCETTRINNSAGRTDIHAAGSSGVSYVYIHDTALLEAGNLISGYTFIRNTSTGDCTVNVEKELEAELKSFGNIYYSGSPYRVVEKRSGEGKLIKQ